MNKQSVMEVIQEHEVSSRMSGSAGGGRLDSRDYLDSRPDR